MTKSEILRKLPFWERKYKINSGELAALIERESNFQPDALGADGEIGLLQLLPGGAIADYEQFNEALSDYYIIDNNLAVGSWYWGKRIPEMLRHFGHENTLRNRVIAWNWGIAHAGKSTLPTVTASFYEHMKAKKKHNYALPVAAGFLGLIAALFRKR